MKEENIFLLEGQKTEVQYFKGIINNRTEVGINPIIDLLPLIRSFPQESHSHPSRILKLIEEHLQEYNSVKVLIDKFIDYCVDNSIIDSDKVNTIDKDLRHYFLDKCNLQIDEKIENIRETISKLTQYMNEKYELTSQIDNIMRYINEQQVTFSKELDFICLIVDRDKGNIKRKQYYKIIEKCREKNIKLFISNPTFEFWLLLHSDEVYKYKHNKILENKKSGNRRFLEKVLSEIFGGYRKENIKFERFLPLIHNAIENSKQFCQDNEGLENQIGSNIGVYLRRLNPMTLKKIPLSN